MVMVKTVPSADAGIYSSIVLDEQQDTMLTGYVCPPAVMVMAKLTPSMVAGKPPPLGKEMMAPAVEAPEDDQL